MVFWAERSVLTLGSQVLSAYASIAGYNVKFIKINLSLIRNLAV